MQRLVPSRPEIGKLLKPCTCCGIEFLADPRNAVRTDLCCPFGCREAQRRRRARERSKAYYRTEAGWKKKKALNGKRSSLRPAAQGRATAPGSSAARSTATGGAAALCSPSASLALLLSYLCRVLALIERRPVGTDELTPVLKTVRQRRMFFVHTPGYLPSPRSERPP